MNGTGWAWVAYLGGWAALIAAAGWLSGRYEARRERRAEAEADAAWLDSIGVGGADWYARRVP